MSFPTHELPEAQLSTLVAQELDRSPSFRATHTKEHDRTAAPAARQPSLLLVIPLLSAAVCAILIGGLMVFARHRTPTPAQQEVAAWKQSCIQGTQPTSSFRNLTSTAAYPGTAPGNFVGSRDGEKTCNLWQAEAGRPHPRSGGTGRRRLHGLRHASRTHTGHVDLPGDGRWAVRGLRRTLLRRPSIESRYRRAHPALLRCRRSLPAETACSLAWFCVSGGVSDLPTARYCHPTVDNGHGQGRTVLTTTP